LAAGNTKNLVIVESPTKARTVGRFLNRNYKVVASMGHIRDLPEKRLGVDVERDFAPQYVIPQKKQEIVRNLKRDVKGAKAVYLATDPDREGEAISWHLIKALGLENGHLVQRVVFHEITKNAIKAAFEHPRELNVKMIDAQQARRILDRLVGYKLSPLLRRKIPRKGLSAGRVQSVAVRMVVDREREIEAFEITEYWTIDAEFAKKDGQGADKANVSARLMSVNGKKSQLNNAADAEKVVQQMRESAYHVGDVAVKEIRRSPAAPFTTSTLQQEAARKLRFSARKTMRTAQQLYEGIKLKGEGDVGLITYMRTDSINMAGSALAQIRGFIEEKFGQAFLPKEPRRFRKKSKLAQEAHEAIRPTSVDREPDGIKPVLTRDQYRLYRLIWQRTVASQMQSALIENTTIKIFGDNPTRDRVELRARGSVIKFPGFINLYTEGRDEGDEQDESGRALPDLSTNDGLDLVDIKPEQRFTKPPPRHTEATLVKTLEENGIGRPSTYAPTMSTIMDRDYVELRDRRFHPTKLGIIVTDLLVEHFSHIVDVEFTADMEAKLDQVASDAVDWMQILHSFYGPFSSTLHAAEQSIARVEIAPEMAGEDCEVCSKPMLIKHGRFGKFLACSGFPECRNSRSIVVKTGVGCPKCRQGDLLERRTRKRKLFFGCSEYPNCDFAVWKRPIAQPCPDCGNLLVESGRDRYRCQECGRTVKLADKGAPVAAG
jgi:DNA topoisomerase-1